MPADVQDLIRRHLRLAPAPALPEIRLYQAHPASGLSHRLGDQAHTPYWAYGWAGGTALARFILDHPQQVAGCRVLDLGTGSGVVAIAAALSGAQCVFAVDSDPNALVASELNARANAVTLTLAQDIPSPDQLDLVLAGDIFYDEPTANYMTPLLRDLSAAGLRVLVGDPGRKWLPMTHLKHLADYTVPDFGRTAEDLRPSAVYAFR